ncbi:hypothetical protein WN55_10203 [Dufourea novaeangliae]|uniref:Uncharacterized protein n=1 Tax=Dufourea novaeangliae TaxID=178035 RepID=A0A154P4Q1_DUFNO|nr:hypothetical protein WN55_10203 [Dufourea novaeangliae]
MRAGKATSDPKTAVATRPGLAKGPVSCPRVQVKKKKREKGQLESKVSISATYWIDFEINLLVVSHSSRDHCIVNPGQWITETIGEEVEAQGARTDGGQAKGDSPRSQALNPSTRRSKSEGLATPTITIVNSTNPRGSQVISLEEDCRKFGQARDVYRYSRRFAYRIFDLRPGATLRQRERGNAGSRGEHWSAMKKEEQQSVNVVASVGAIENSNKSLIASIYPFAPVTYGVASMRLKLSSSGKQSARYLGQGPVEERDTVCRQQTRPEEEGGVTAPDYPSRKSNGMSKVCVHASLNLDHSRLVREERARRRKEGMGKERQCRRRWSTAAIR